jgi:hypothetical protein
MAFLRAYMHYRYAKALKNVYIRELMRSKVGEFACGEKLDSQLCSNIFLVV